MADAGYIVVVDDDRRVRESIHSVVESAGHEPLTFASGEDFLHSLALDRARCVIADVVMPGMSGVELQRRLRSQHPRMPVIFITGHDDDEIRRQAIEGGAVGFMYKPFDGADLLSAISLALSESRPERDGKE
jgi:FixJ family two-component response regulator